MALQQVPQPDHRRGGAADPAPQRLQDQQPDRARPHRPTRSWSSTCEGAAGRRTLWKATTPRRCTSSWPAPWTRPSRTSGTSKAEARNGGDTTRPRWPMIVLRSPKGWTGPKVVDGLQIEGTFRSHQVPLLVDAEHPDHVALLESWMKSYRPEELFDDDGRLVPELAELAPKGDRRMGANPHANGGMLLRDLRMPDFRAHALDVPSPGAVDGQDTLVLGEFLRDVIALNEERRQLSHLRSRRDAVEPARRGVRDDQPSVGRPTGRERRVPRARGTRARLDAERAPVRGLAGGLPAHRTARTVQLLRGLHPHRRLDVQPARQMVEGDLAAAVAAGDRLAELPARLARVAAGSQRLHPPGPRLSRPRRQQEGRHRAGLPPP